MKPSTLIACSLLVFATMARAQDEWRRQPSPGENLAAGRPCAFDPAPAYPYCTDEGDANQLTDGLYNGCDWTDEGTVGWQVRRDRVFLIEIDLGAASSIGKITFDTVTGGAQVTFPAAALAFVSDDGESYRYLGDVLTESVPQTEFLNHRFEADSVRAFGRYVRIAVIAGGFYVFCDEIEIVRGEHAREEAGYVDFGPIPADEVRAYANELIPWVTQKNATLTLLREAAAAVDARGPALGDQTLIEDALEIAQVVHVEAFGYNYRDDAIVPAGEDPFVLQPGTSKRIWLTLRTRGLDVAPGEYASTIIVAAEGEAVATVPVRLRIWPLRFPDDTTLHSNCLLYTSPSPRD